MNVYLKLHKIEGIIKVQKDLWNSFKQGYITIEEYIEQDDILDSKLLLVKLNY
jgi:hypothetical protein